MRKINLLFLTCLLGSVLVACNQRDKSSSDQRLISDNIEFALAQMGKQIEIIEASETFINPITVKANGSIHYGSYRDWRSGFFPGSVWYLYELSGDPSLKEKAIEYTEELEEAQHLTSHHDIGFIIDSSYGNAFRLTNDERYKEVIIQAAKSLTTRYREQPGVIQSWDSDRGWQSERGWECPVIIDNMMNLELLFNATKYSGDSLYYNIAVSHADRTLEEHFRDDNSTYHVIDYSLVDGSVRNRHTAQGYSHESAWSRGQAWAIYGYAMCYRETREQRYLDQAIKAFEFLRDHPRMPEDLIPYWDMDAPDIPEALRDVSTASVTASALYEMSTFPVPDAASYKEYADKIMVSLSSDAYRAKLGDNGNFILMHSVGSIPHDNEIDKPLNYADYYFLEALVRKKMVEK